MATTCIGTSLIGENHVCKSYTKKSKVFNYEASTSSISLEAVLGYIRKTLENELKEGGDICLSFCRNVYYQINAVRLFSQWYL